MGLNQKEKQQGYSNSNEKKTKRKKKKKKKKTIDWEQNSSCDKYQFHHFIYYRLLNLIKCYVILLIFKKGEKFD